MAFRSLQEKKEGDSHRECDRLNDAMATKLTANLASVVVLVAAVSAGIHTRTEDSS